LNIIFNMKKQLISEEFKRMQKLAGLINENKVKNSYVIKDEELSDEDGDFYFIDKKKALNYLKQFNNKDIRAKAFINDDEGWGEFEQYLEDVEKMSDKEIEDSMREEMSYYFFSEPDAINENEQMFEAKEDLFNKYKSKIETLRDEFVADLKSNLKDLKKLSKEDKTKLSQMIRNLTIALDDALSENKNIKEVDMVGSLGDIDPMTAAKGSWEKVFDKYKSKIENSPAFKKIVDTIVDSMSPEQRKSFVTRFGNKDVKDIAMSSEIKSQMDSLNENSDNNSIVKIIAKIFRTIAGLNLLTLGGGITGLISALVGVNPWSGTFGALYIGGLIVSCIIVGVCNKILDYSDDMPLL